MARCSHNPPLYETWNISFGIHLCFSQCKSNCLQPGQNILIPFDSTVHLLQRGFTIIAFIRKKLHYKRQPFCLPSIYQYLSSEKMSSLAMCYAELSKQGNCITNDNSPYLRKQNVLYQQWTNLTSQECSCLHPISKGGLHCI